MEENYKGAQIEAALFSDTTPEEIMADPHKYGLPTLEEWPRYRENYIKSLNSEFALIDKGGNNTKHLYRKVKFRYGLYAADSLEEMEKILNNEGLKINDVEWKPEFTDNLGGKSDVTVFFVKKEKPLEPNGQ